MIKLLLVLMMFGWAGCTQQEEAAEIKLSDRYEYAADGAGFLGYVTGKEKSKFDPTKHYIISIDTVGFERKLKMANNNYTQLRSGREWQYGYWDTTTGGGIVIIRFWDFDGWLPIFDTTWADKEHLLVTPEEAEKLRKLIK